MTLPDLLAPLAPLQVRLIHDAFVDVATRSPARLALVGAGRSYRYGELDALSTCLAARLVRDGVRPGHVVAIVSDRNPELVCAILGVLKAGAAFAMIDAAYPASRIRDCLGLIRPTLVLTAGRGPERAEIAANLPSLQLAAGVEALEAQLAQPDAELAPPSAEGLAYLSFTSGSTGTPKVIATGHAPLPHFVAWQIETFGLTEADHFSMLSGIAHDPLLRDIFTPLSIGATLHIPEQSTLYDPTALAAWLHDQEITVSHLTPALGEILLAGVADGVLERMRCFFFGGDALKPSLPEALRRAAPHAEHVNFYGTTETPQAMAYYRIAASAEYERIPLGRGIADVQLLVLREDASRAAVGEVGELCVRTRYLSRGYVGDAQGTAGKFIINPHTRDAGDRIYRTGDLGCFLPDGSVDFRGRADDQVKIRGYRVELGEVAAALRKQVGVQEAVVLTRLTPSSETQLVAYVVLAGEADKAAAQLAEPLRGVLPSYMLPSAYVTLERLPLLPNGKLDRAALRALPISETRASTAHEERNAEEQKLVEIWRAVLGVPDVSVQESFYDLGGDSLTAIRVMARMRLSGIDENLCRGILQGKTIAQMVGQVAGNDDGAALHLPEHQRLLLNIMRGLLIVLLVAGHWAPGVLRRIPGLSATLPSLRVLFNMATPGFAIAFGMTIGFVYYPVYRLDPARVRALIMRGAAMVAGGVAVFALVRVGMNLLDPDHFWHPLGNVLPFYVLALLSVPAWFWVISRTKYERLGALLLAVAFAVTHFFVMQISWTEEAWFYVGFLLGKYSYFNMSVGVMGGLVLGLTLKQAGRVPRGALVAGLLATVATTLVVAIDSSVTQLSVGDDMRFWKWPFYGGLYLAALYLLDRAIEPLARARLGAQAAMRMLAVVGQLGLPLFILHFVATDMGNASTLLGAPDWLDILVSLAVFFLGAGFLVRTVYGLFHGQVGRASPPSAAPFGPAHAAGGGEPAPVASASGAVASPAVRLASDRPNPAPVEAVRDSSVPFP